MRNVRSFFLFVGLLYVGLFLSGCSRKEEPKSKESSKIVFAFAAPLSGDQAVTGQDMLRGAQLAIKQINESGGVLGSNIELDINDDKANNNESGIIANLVSSKNEVLAVIGHLNSGCSNAALPVYNKNGIPMLTPVSTDDKLSGLGYRSFFRIPLKNSLQGRYAATYAVGKLKMKTFFLIDDGSPYGKGIVDEFAKSVTSMGGVIVERDQVSEKDREFRQLLSKVKSHKVDLVYLGIMYPQAGPLIKQAKESGITSKFFGGDGLFGGTLLQYPTDGVYVTFIAPLAARDSIQEHFFQRFKAEFKDSVNSYAPLAYDAVMITAKALAEAGSPNRSKLIERLHANGFEYSGVTGNIRFDSNGDSVDRKTFLYIVMNEKFVLVE